MVRASVLALALVLPTTAYAQLVTEMTPERIAEAIAEGQQKRASGVYRLGDYYFTTPYSRVVAAAAHATRNYKPFTAADVTPEMVAPEIEVVVPPDVSAGYRSAVYNRAPSVTSATSVVIMPKGKRDIADALQPLRVTTSDESYQNLMGATWKGTALIARFPLSALSDRHELRVRYADNDEERTGLKTRGIR